MEYLMPKQFIEKRHKENSGQDGCLSAVERMAKKIITQLDFNKYSQRNVSKSHQI